MHGGSASIGLKRKRINNYVRPPLYKKQREAIFACVDVNGQPARYSLIEASTKSGKTVGCLAWIFEQAWRFGKPNKNYWWVAPVYAQAKIAFRRLRVGVPQHLRKTNEQDMTITLPNGAVIWFKSGEKPDNLYGEDVYAAVLDEASRLREESWYAVRSTLTATQGRVRIIGNVKGRRNWFYKMARRAQMGYPGYAYAKITAFDAVAAGVLASKEIEDARATLPEAVFRELYEAEASDDEGNPFGLKHIAACVERQGKGLSENRPVANGVDLAKAVNYSVVTALDRDARVCGFDRFRIPWAETKSRVLLDVGRFPTLVDSTGVGDAIVEDLNRQRSSIEGFVFTAKSKQMLLESLAVAIQSHELGVLEGPMRQELEVFEYVVTRTGVRYAAPEGYDDDCVMSLALAWEMYRRVRPTIGFTGPHAPFAPNAFNFGAHPDTEGDEAE